MSNFGNLQGLDGALKIVGIILWVGMMAAAALVSFVVTFVLNIAVTHAPALSAVLAAKIAVIGAGIVGIILAVETFKGCR